MRDANVRNHLKYICSAYFADGDRNGHFNCTEKAIVDLKLHKSVKFFFFFLTASVVNHSYNSNVEINTLPFLYSFLSPSCWPDVAKDSTVNPLAFYSDNKFKRTAPLGHLLEKSSLLRVFFFLKFKDSEK